MTSGTDPRGGPAPPVELDGRVAVVTGAAAGIGRASAVALARAGAAVAAVDIADAQATVTEIEALGGGAVAVTADVSRSPDVTRAVDAVVAWRGRIDVLVNAVGIQRYGTALDTDEATWDEVMAVNVKSHFLMAKACLPHLLARAGATIVNIGSVQSVGAFGGAVAYVTSKAAVANLTKALAADFAPHVRVNCVCPGSVDTPMLRSSAAALSPDDPAGALADWAALHPLGRIADPHEVAEVVAFLAGPRSSFCTGSLFMVDGGMTGVLR